MQEITQRIRQKCEELNLAISQLEKRALLTNASIDKWEKGQKPSYDKLYRIADSLNVSLDWLITGNSKHELTPDEERLIDLYRQADSRGKRKIIGSAELEVLEQEPVRELSASKIG